MFGFGKKKHDDDEFEEIDDVMESDLEDESDNISEDGSHEYIDLSDEDDEVEEDDEEEEEADPSELSEFGKAPSSILGQPSLMHVIGPSWWSTDDLMEEFFVLRENMKSQTYGIPAYIPPAGYPRMLDTNVFAELLAQGNVDLTLDIVPQKRRDTMHELSNMMNVIQANARFQAEQNQTFQLRENTTKYNDLDNIMDQLQFDENRMFDVSTSMLVYGDSQRDMEKNFGTAADLLADKNISVTPYAKRVKSGYFQTIPIGARMYNLDDTYRNMDRRALAVLDVARNAAGRFNGGIPFGVNQATPSQNTEFLNIFGTKQHRPINYNMGIVGESGGGKSTSNKVKMAREVAILGYEHRSIDPDGEYILLAKKLGQLNLTITADADFVINPCAVSVMETPLEEEIQYDEYGNLMTDEELEEAQKYSDNGKKIVTHKDGTKFVQFVPILSTIENIKGFVNLIIKGDGNENGLTVGEKSRLEDAITKVINDLGITSNPDSLFMDQAGTINNQYYERMPKPEPTLSDIYKVLKEQNTDENGNEDPKVTRILDGLKPYLKTGTKPIFDGQTFFGNGRAATLNDYKYVNFDISQLEGELKTVAYYVLTQYLWERWMKDPAKATTKKVLDADEILQFIDNDEMFAFFEIIARRDRKRNGSLTWLTQDIERFQGNAMAKALVTNSEFMYILQIKPEHKQLMKETMDLTDGALEILTGHPEPGEGILRQGAESIWIKTNPSDYEMTFAESNRSVALERQRNKPNDIFSGLM